LLRPILRPRYGQCCGLPAGLRREGERWVIETARGLDGVPALPSLGMVVPLAEIYADVLPDDTLLDATVDA
jgi:hypothetical protein